MSASDDEAARMCYRKKALAENYARAIVRREGGAVRAYQCPVCAFWHITKNSGGVNRAANSRNPQRTSLPAIRSG